MAFDDILNGTLIDPGFATNIKEVKVALPFTMPADESPRTLVLFTAEDMMILPPEVVVLSWLS